MQVAVKCPVVGSAIGAIPEQDLVGVAELDALGLVAEPALRERVVNKNRVAAWMRLNVSESGIAALLASFGMSLWSSAGSSRRFGNVPPVFSAKIRSRSAAAFSGFMNVFSSIPMIFDSCLRREYPAGGSTRKRASSIGMSIWKSEITERISLS